MATPRANDDNSTNATPRHPVSVSVSYWIPGTSGSHSPTKTWSWSESNVPEARIGLPPGVEPAKPQAGDYAYSGMHDQGPLPPPREGGPMALLVACVQQAKQANDEFLTRVIEEEMASKEEHKDKRAKTNGG